MKYLLVLLLVVYVLWRWRAGQAVRTGEAPRRPQSVPPEPVAVVACAYCDVHVPLGQAVCVGPRYFCSAAHREAAGA